ncbi:MAG: Vi polysaccharide biosynthesis UDP-N-acetylglucosamine C-6 dehydrogenase TviB, partial [Pseudomonadota bacterium]|nr:Vi polysaccharide biosynthesis UDP-N-acetylglucosamine C-6 dehydrogenase TviB [Pseudomonadota bacterium]
MQENAIAIIGVGYVGLPLALSLAKFHPKVLGYDLDNERVSELNSGFDRNNNLKNVIPSNLEFTVDLARIERATTYIIT